MPRIKGSASGNLNQRFLQFVRSGNSSERRDTIKSASDFPQRALTLPAPSRSNSRYFLSLKRWLNCLTFRSDAVGFANNNVRGVLPPPEHMREGVSSGPAGQLDGSALGNHHVAGCVLRYEVRRHHHVQVAQLKVRHTINPPQSEDSPNSTGHCVIFAPTQFLNARKPS